MDIKSLLTYPDEDIVSYIPTIDKIIAGHLPQPEALKLMMLTRRTTVKKSL
jgi:hypothetical protein